MKNYLTKNSTITVISITIISVLSSFFITLMLLKLFEDSLFIDDKIYYFIIFLAVINPLIIAPFASYKLVSLYFSINKLNKKLHYVNRYDHLTNIFNRNYFFELAKKEFELFKIQNSSISIFLIDYDYFKRVNDTYGHNFGDKLLKKVTKTINDNIRDSDIFARFGGEEFILLCKKTNKKAAKEIAHKIVSKVNEEEVIIEGKKVKMSVSIGFVSLEDGDNKNLDLEEFIKLADEGLYLAKNNGRNRYESINI